MVTKTYLPSNLCDSSESSDGSDSSDSSDNSDSSDLKLFSLENFFSPKNYFLLQKNHTKKTLFWSTIKPQIVMKLKNSKGHDTQELKL